MSTGLPDNKANAILRKAADGKYGIAGVCVVSRLDPTKFPRNLRTIDDPHSTTWKASLQQSVPLKPSALLP